MNSFAKVISTSFNDLQQRMIKFLQSGRSDVRMKPQAAPYGVDSSPIKGMVAIHAETTVKGNSVIVGYINKNQLAKDGEFRTFSTDANGVLKFYIWQKDDGTCEIGGNTKNMVRYQELETGLNAQKDLINVELGKIATAITALGGAYTVAPITIDVSGARINEIKTL